MPDSVLSARQLEKSFVSGKRDVPIVRGVDLVASRGEVLAIEGPSGSGKTTLLCMLGCLLSPSAGSVVIDGLEAPFASASGLGRVRREKIGFVFQHFNLLPALTVHENVLYGMELKRRLVPGAAKRATELLEAVGMSGFLDVLPENLSGGQKQRVAVARALVGEPALILADEPTANLDSESTDQVMDRFTALARDLGSAVVMVTHDPRLRRICDRILCMRDGRFVDA